MGYFTWTDASRKPRITKDGYYHRGDMIARSGYDDFAKVVCPDNSEIKEWNYQGYGIFGGQDVYDLVTEWNRPFLKHIYKMIRVRRKGESFFGSSLEKLAGYYQDRDEEAFQKELDHLSEDMPDLEKEWKRTIGIAIACDDEDNESLPYPIKITSKKEFVSYEDLRPSCSCQ